MYLTLSFVVFIVLVFLYVAKDLPDPTKISQRKVIESTKIYDREGKTLLYDIHGEEKRTIVAYNDISQFIKDAVIVAEDDNFYNHRGIDIKGIIRAFFANIRNNEIKQGGSTITQQLIKNTLVGKERTYTRKIKEAILAIEMEMKYSKDEILDFYLNQIPFGSSAYGVESAAQTFFNKPAKDINLAESAILASVLRATTYYSPYGSHPEELKNRQEYILNRMTFLGYITQEQTEQAKKTQLNYNAAASGINAPHFIMYIIEYLEEKYGRETLENGGLKVYTTLDWELQKEAETLVEKYADINEKKYKASNASLVVIDPKTGQILTMVGSRNYFDLKNDGNVNVATRNRQPGSSFKPYAYAMALKKGYTPETIFFDLETNFDTTEVDPYIPRNFDGKFRGPVSMRNSLAQSLNIPSVKILYLAGINDTIDLAESLGITTLKDRSRFGLSLVLGGGEVKLLDMVSAYSVFANDGVRNKAASILKIETPGGDILEQWQADPKRVLETQISRQISDILSDAQARVPAIGLGSVLEVKGAQVAVKTGTTQEARDGWTIGFTTSLAVGVWTGNNNNSPMLNSVSGFYTASPLWNNFFSFANNKYPSERFIEPELVAQLKTPLNGSFINNKIVKINKITGGPANNNTPPDLIKEVGSPEVHNILYYVDKSDPTGNAPANPVNDPQFNNWEGPVLKWVEEENNKGANYNQPINIPDNPINDSEVEITIIAPIENSSIQGSINIQIRITKIELIRQVDYYFNGNLIKTKLNGPFDLIFIPPPNTQQGENLITIKAYSLSGKRYKKDINIFWSK